MPTSGHNFLYNRAFGGHRDGGVGAPQVILKCTLQASLGLFSLVFDRVYYATNSDSLNLERAASA